MTTQGPPSQVCLAIDGGFIGGGQKHVFHLAQFLREKKVAVTVFCSERGPFSQLLEKNQIPYCLVHMGKSLSRQNKKQWKEQLGLLKPSILHLHGAVAGFWGRWSAPRRRPYSILYTVHGIHFTHRENPLARFFYWGMERIFRGKTDLVLCVCDSDKNKWLKMRLAEKSKIRVVSNGINLKNFGLPSPVPRGSFGFKKEQFLIGIVARLNKQKGHVDALRALAQLIPRYPHFHLLMVGEGEEKNRLKALTEKYGLADHVHYLGFVDNIPAVLSILDLHLMSSWWEGQPISLLEAMAAGVPSVVTGVDGIPEVVRQETEALIVPPHQPAAMAEAIEKIYLDTELRKRLAGNGLQRVKVFEEGETYARLLELYQTIDHDLHSSFR